MDSSRNGAASPGASPGHDTPSGSTGSTPLKGFFRNPLSINPVSVTAAHHKSSGSSSQSSSVSSPPSSGGGGGSGTEKKALTGSRFVKVLVPESSPRRNSLFNTFKAGLKGKKDQSPRDSPTGNHFLSTLCEASPSCAPVSPRRLSLFDQLTNFRQRSKSDCRAKKLATKANENNSGGNDRRARKAAQDALSVYATIHNGQRPPLTTISSVEEERFCGCSGATPVTATAGGGLPMLYVDTQLANSPVVSAGAPNQCCLSARNPNEINKDYEERRRFFSGSSRLQSDDRRYLLLMQDMVPRSMSASVSPYRPQDSGGIIHKDAWDTSKLLLFKHGNVSLDLEVCEANNLERRELIFYHLLRANRSFNILPSSNKIVVLHESLPVKKAFPALLVNTIRAATLLDKQQMFSGMLTISDFIQMCFHYESMGRNIIDEFLENTIEDWKNIQKDIKKQPFVFIYSEESLFRAIELMRHFRVHRIPVLDEPTFNIIYILTYKRLFKYLYIYVVGVRPQFLKFNPREMGIGTYENIISVTLSTPLRETLNLLMDNHLSSVPVVDENNVPINIYSKFDFLSSVHTNTYTELDISMAQAIHNRDSWTNTEEIVQKPNFFETLATCEDTDNLWAVMGIFHDYQVHRVVVVDHETKKMVGIISLSDLFKFLVLIPPKEDRIPTPIEERLEQVKIDETERLDRLANQGRQPYPRTMYGITTFHK